jgi:RHS repeat-associated protein
MLKMIFVVFIRVLFAFPLFFPALGNASIARSDIPLEMPQDNWRLGMLGVNIHDHIFVSMPDRSLKFSFIDMEVTGIGFPLRVERIYTGRPHPKGMLGKEWMLGLEQWVDQSTKDSIAIINADRRVVFKKAGKNVFRGNNGTVIEKNGDRSLLMTLKNGHSTLFSKNGRPIEIKEPNGNSLTYKYKGDRLTSIEESSGRRLFFFYNAGHLLEEVNDDAGRSVAFSYDSVGRLAAVNRFNLQKTTFNYDKASRLAGIGFPGGLELSVDYEGKDLARVKKITSNQNEWFLFEIQKDQGGIKVSDHSGNSFNYSYYRSGESNIISISGGSGWFTGYRIDKNGRLAAWKRPDGNLIRYWYDSLDRMVKTSDSSENAVQYKYKGRTNLFSQKIDSKGGKTFFEYDKKNNLISITPPEQEKIRFLRFPNGIIREKRQGDMLISSNTIDGHGDSLTVKSGFRGKTTMSYDSLGRVTTERSGDGPTYAYRYNDLDQITHIFRNRDLFVEYSYDLMGNLKTAKDAKGRISRYLFDRGGRLKEAKTPDNKTFTLERTVNGYQVKRLFPNQASRDYTYNHAGMLTRLTDPFGKSRQFKWTPSLLLDRIIDENGMFVRNKYDSAGKVVEKRYSSGESHLFRYKGDDLVSMESPHFSQEYNYDKQGRITSMEDKVLDLTMRCNYDRSGRLKFVSVGGAGSIEYQYDQAGRIKGVVDPDSGRTGYIYDVSGRIKEIQYPNGVLQKFTYDEDVDAVNSIKVISGGKVLFHETYVYEKEGLLSETHNKTQKTVKSYIYNADGELTGYVKKPAGSNPEKWTYSYDGNGNVVEELLPEGKISYEYKGIGRITKRGKGKMRHDPAGNLTTGVFGRDKYNFEYDFDGRLVKAGLPDGSIKEYRYDPLGRLIYYEKDGDERHILWNGNRRILELDKRKRLVKFYVHGPGLDDVISIEKNGKFYFHQDRLASVRLVTDDRGRAVSSYEYTPFGKPLYEKSEALSDGIIFAGRPYDSDIGCYYMRARFYSPTLKRFLTRDPMEGLSTMPLTWHPYLYAMNNPVNFNDPEGEIFAIIGGVIVYGGAAVVSFAGGYLAGTVINKTYEEGKQIVKEGPTKYLRDAAQNKIDSAQQMVERGLNSGIHSYSANRPDDQEGITRRLDNTRQTIEAVAPLNRFQREAVIQSNPNASQRIKDHNENMAGYISDGIVKVGDTVADAGTKAVKEGTRTGRDLQRIEQLPGDLINDKTQNVPGLTTVVSAATNQAGNLVRDAHNLAAQDAEKNANQPEPPKNDRPPAPPVVQPPAPPPPPVKTEVTPPVTPPVKPPEKPPVKPPVKTETQPEPERLPDKTDPEPPVEPPPPPPDKGGKNTGNLGGDILVDLLGATSHGERRNIIADHLNRSGTKATDDQIDRMTDRIEQTMGLNQPKPPAVSSQDLINRYDQRDQQRNQAVTDRTSRDSFATGYGSRQGDRYGQDDLQRDLQSDQQWAQNAGDRRHSGHKPPPGGSSGTKGSSGSSSSTGQGLSNITVNSETITVTFWDHGQEDGDIIDILLNGKVLRGGILLKKAHQSFTVTLTKGKNVFGVRAVNEGKVSPNTATVKFSNVTQGKDVQVYKIKSGQRTDMNIQY